jgi:hypothetical protein
LIFSDIDVSAADLYDIFGFPVADGSGSDRVVIALTFAAVPQTDRARVIVRRRRCAAMLARRQDLPRG